MNLESRKMIMAGWIVSALTGIFMLVSGINLIFIRTPEVKANFAKFGYPEHAIAIIGWCALISSLLYLIPKTTVVGAILLTGYLGGAIATHLRVDDPTYMVPLIVGILVWSGIFLREPRLRELLSFSN